VSCACHDHGGVWQTSIHACIAPIGACTGGPCAQHVETCACLATLPLPLARLCATIAAIVAPPTKLPLGHLLTAARNRLGMSQRQFGPALHASHRTASRWDTGRSRPSVISLRQLAALLAPIDLALAAEAAAHAHDTLEELGLAPPPPPPLPPPVPPRPPVTTKDLVDAVVCAGAEASDTSPRALRPVLYVAFQRALELGLSVEDVATALAPT
jgi:transcriptional regulator with XRE-family HTH domain